jgi:TGF-beta receptor type-1
LLYAGPAESIQCYCDERPGLPSPECLLPNEYRCKSTRGCYLRRWYSEQLGRIKQSWGCIKGQHGTGAQFDLWEVYCGALDTSAEVYKCCNSSDLCNRQLSITLEIEGQEPVLSPTPSLTLTEPRNSRGTSTNIVIIIAVTVSLVALLCLLLLLSLFLILRRRQRLTNGGNLNHHPTTTVHWTNQNRVDGVLSSTLREGVTYPCYQVLSDIRDIVKLNYLIGIGRFGVFYHGHYEGTAVALKKFSEEHHAAWLRESLMYTSILQPQENILTFYATAMAAGNTDDAGRAGGSGTGSEQWLMTRYHEYGSLKDYLRQHTVPGRTLLQMSASIASGLAHLHSDNCGNQVNVPVAHCNLTSRNILVKDNLSCVVGDFRCAVFKLRNETSRPEEVEEEGKETTARGAVRYMAPEVLSQQPGGLSFETLKQADVYSLGLVLWEICQRGNYTGVAAEGYQVPFQGMVPPEPSLEDMQRLVVNNRVQPTISNRWNNSKLLREMTKVMRECWYYTSTARPTAVYLKKKLLKMSQELENTDPATEDEATVPRKQPEESGRHSGEKLHVSAI